MDQQTQDTQSTQSTQDIQSTQDTQDTSSNEKVKVDEILLKEILEIIRPSLIADGGDMEYVSVDDDGVVTLRLTGACSVVL